LERNGLPVTPSSGSAPEIQKTLAIRRQTALRLFKDRYAQQEGTRPSDKTIAQLASQTWKERTPVDRWKRADPRSTHGDDRRIRALLKQYNVEVEGGSG
jgi:hypothetical protein